MSEEEFVASWYPRIRVLAAVKARQHGFLIAVEDLTQIGIIAVMNLFRTWKGEGIPPKSLVCVAARCEMHDRLRGDYRGARFNHSITDEIAENTPSYDPNPAETIARRLDGETALSMATGRRRALIDMLRADVLSQEIARNFGVTKSRASQLKTEAIDEIRRKLHEATTIRAGSQ